MSEVHSNKGRRFPPEILTDDEVQRLIAACSGKAPTGIRNRALITILYRAGLRVSEALSLYPKDLNPEVGTVRVLHGKGAKARTVGLDAASFAILACWLDVRQKLDINGQVPLFCTLQGKKIKSSYVRALFKRLATKAGIERRVHPHGLRHTLAAQLALEGYPVNLIQLQLGHSSLPTTSRYLAHIAPGELINTMQARSWKLRIPLS
jgi:site-specific recombinase XerD